MINFKNAIKPEFDKYIFTMTDDTGMLQHAKYGIPDPTKGYTTDDNARALIVTLMLYEKFPEQCYLDLIRRYLSFLMYAQNEDGTFKNFMCYNRNFCEAIGSEDCFGRCIWALTVAISAETIPQHVKEACAYMLNLAAHNIKKLHYLRSKSYVLMGLCNFPTLVQGGEVEDDVKNIVRTIIDKYRKASDETWKWFEASMTYSNAIIPIGLLRAYTRFGEKELLEVGLESLDFLLRETFEGVFFKPIGCNGWYRKKGNKASFDEQPLEACETILACIDAYKCSYDKKYLESAKACLNWYHGQNSMGVNMIDQQSKGCYDGITKSGVNLNQGAESIISYCMASLALSEMW